MSSIPGPPGYVLELLRESTDFTLYRGRQHGNPSPVLAIALSAEQPSPHSLRRLEHEYSLAAELDPAWAAKPLALTRHEGRTILLLKDPGGEPLDRVLERNQGQPLELTRFLRIAIGLATALGQAHRRGLIHKDIKPANVLVDDADNVWLTAFGIASQLPRERQSPVPPEIIAGTLAYMAPEQTGRMNRSIDARSDLYALGVTLYQMLTGALPFAAADPLEWVHCHIARQPTPPGERATVPEPLSAITMKLLAKNAEERYQTASGLEADLRWCLGEWQSHGRIDPFPLGTHDSSDRLLIPEKLYGREREIDALPAAFDRVVAQGTPELVLVSGYSGVGKSSVVNELHKVLVPPHGLFASGKFDQYKRDIPYATLAHAFQNLIRPLLSKSEAELSNWREALREALGPNGRLIVDLVPELKLIIGEQPPVRELPPRDMQGRFRLVFRRFIGVFARPEHPLALFLYDVQWLDAATLDLLGGLLRRPDVRHLMLVGAYRDNEVNSAHPLMLKLEAIRQAGALVQELILAPLAREDLGRLITDSLHCEPERATPLAELVHEKTAGNPFFAIQFISALAEEALLTFDHGEARWSWDLNRIQAKGYTDNVVDLMVGKLNRLPVETQKALQQLACLGNVAQISTLSIVHGRAEGVHSDLWEAVRLELIVRLENSYKFVHDRVQEAAYSLIPEELRAEAHLRIGRLLAAHTPPEKREEAIFEIVNQINRGAELIVSGEERDQIAELNLIAGKRAKTSTAYASALMYLTAGMALLGENNWDRQNALTFALELHRAEAEFLTGDLAAAEERLSMLSGHAAKLVDRAAVTCLRVDLYITLDQFEHAVAVGLEYLGHLGVEWSLHPTDEDVRQEYKHIWQRLGNRPIEHLVNLPLMSDLEPHATMDVLTRLMPAALQTDEKLLCLLTLRAVNLSLEHGNSDASGNAYAWLAMHLGPYFGEYAAGFRFGHLGVDLVEKRGLDGFKARIYLCFGAVVNPWTRHMRAGRPLIRSALEAASKSGDVTFRCYCYNNLITNFLACGEPLSEVEREALNGLEHARKIGFGHIIDFITVQLQLVRTLRGLKQDLASLNDAEFDENRFEHHLGWYWIRKLQACVYAKDYSSALKAAARAQELLWTSRLFFEQAEYHFYAALAKAGYCDALSADQRAPHLEALAAHHRQLKLWAENCPENFETRAALVGAEIARIEGRELDAERLYEQAIRSAQANGFVNNEALANELAARFYAARGFEKIAHPYLQDARYCYLRWGAAGKVRQLDQLHPRLKEEQPVPGPTSTIGASVEHLDLATVIKVSQAVSGEIVLEKLIDTLMRTAIEHAGAQRGLLILPREGEQRIEAEATTSGHTVIVRLQEASVAAAALPESVLHYVVRTHESVILDDASAQSPFSADEYIRQHHARSVLCLPLLKQAKLIGLLYLENNVTSHVFTPARIAVLKLLASEAAISLENTRLYKDLKERESRIRRLVDANIIGIILWNVKGRISEANEAFLRMVEYDREDLLSGRVRWRELTPEKWREADEQALAELAATGICKPFEKEYFRKDGSRVPVLVGAALLPGTPDEGVGFVLDLTERKRAEDALRRSEVYLAEAQRISHTGSFRWTIATGEILWSEETFRILQYAPTTNPTLDLVLQRVHPKDKVGVREAMERVSRYGKDEDYEHRLLMPDGSIKHIRVLIHAEREKSGELDIVGAVRDITLEKEAEEKLRRAFEEIKELKEQLYRENLALREEIDETSMFEEIVGSSEPLRKVLVQVAKVAQSDSTVLILGETGTGKELIARAIHKRSNRSTRAFVRVNCAAIPPLLIPSELFGHEKGAFTGALQRRLGRFELADGGTIFLDEIGDLPAETQIAFLPVLQDHEIERVGNDHPISIDVRVLAATNRDLRTAVEAGTFRQDLFYRLNVFPIQVPALRERVDDMPLLIAYLVERYATKAGKKIRTISKRTLALFQAYA